jgi:hypothetical protein
MPTPTSSSQNNSSGGVLPGGNVPMRVYFKSNVAAAHTYNTVAISPTALVRDVVKLVRLTKKKKKKKKKRKTKNEKKLNTL